MVRPEGVISLWMLLSMKVWVPRPDLLSLDKVEVVVLADAGLSLLLPFAWPVLVRNIWFGLPADAGLSDPENPCVAGCGGQDDQQIHLLGQPKHV